MTDDVETRLLERGDPGATPPDVGEAELLEGLQRFADGAATRLEARGQVALGRQALPRAVLAEQDLVAQDVGDLMGADAGGGVGGVARGG